MNGHICFLVDEVAWFHKSWILRCWLNARLLRCSMLQKTTSHVPESKCMLEKRLQAGFRSCCSTGSTSRIKLQRHVLSRCMQRTCCETRPGKSSVFLLIVVLVSHWRCERRSLPKMGPLRSRRGMRRRYLLVLGCLSLKQ